jgi:hypothetical protein
MRKESFLCYGVRSRTADGKHAVLMDFDGEDQGDVVLRLLRIQAKHNLGDFFIIQNTAKKGYFHAYCPTRVTRQEYLSILAEACVDENSLIPLNKWHTKTTILRFRGKGKMRHIITLLAKNPNRRRNSLGHLLFLNKVFNINIDKYTKTDKLKTISVDRYTTAKP